MTPPIEGACSVCESPEGLLYDISDACRVDVGRYEPTGQLCLCERCRDLIATGWASVWPSHSRVVRS